MISGILSLFVILAAPTAWALCRKRRAPLMLGFLAAIVTGTILYLGTIYIHGYELEREMYRFDLNGDREFSNDELTDQARAAIKRWSSDTGRSLAPIVAPVAVFIWTILVFGILLGTEAITKSIRKEK